MKHLFSLTLFVFTIISASAFDVTFRVDMSTQSGFTTPEVNGTFNNWCGNCFQMSDANNDNIWEATTSLAEGAYQFKFSADNWNMEEFLQPGSSCTVTSSGFTNRILDVTADTILPVICWSSCVDCSLTPNYYDVTFRVDMSEQSGFTTPEVNGSFNGWCGNCTAMTDSDNDSIWEITVTLAEGTYEYKFSFDNWSGQETLVPGSSCTITTGEFTNRFLELTSDDTLDVVCFGTCSQCGETSGPVLLTFAVDMSNVPFDFTAPELNGTFNNWCGSCAAMTDDDNDGVWTIAIPLEVDSSYQYKFTYDNWTGQEQLNAADPCVMVMDGFINRYITVTPNMDLPAVCWESCNACATVGVSERFDIASWEVYPNPSNGTLNFTAAIEAGSTIVVRDISGKVLHSERVNSTIQSLDFSRLNQGMYTLEVHRANATSIVRRWVKG